MVKKRPHRPLREESPLSLTDESLYIKRKKDRPAVLIKRLKWCDKKTGKLSRVELFLILEWGSPQDDARLFGYDCAHQSQFGEVHRHWYGNIERCQLTLDEVVLRFEEEVKNYLERTVINEGP